MENWYVLTTYPGAELRTLERIKIEMKKNFPNELLDVFVPLGEKNEILVSGYVFVKMIMNNEVIKFVMNAHGRYGVFLGYWHPEVVEEAQILKFKKGVEEFIGKREINEGSKVKITSGLFKDFEGIVKSFDEEKNLVSVEVFFFGRDTTTEVPVSEIILLDN